MRAITAQGVGRIIAAAANDGYISRAEAQKIADILADAEMAMGIEASELPDLGCKRILELRAELLGAISDEIDQQLREKAQP